MSGAAALIFIFQLIAFFVVLNAILTVFKISRTLESIDESMKKISNKLDANSEDSSQNDISGQ